MDLAFFINASCIIIALLIAIIGHEIMHGLAAYRYGDTTAKDAKRLSINPIVHIDLVGTLIIPAILIMTSAPFLFGWAKPVPVDDRVVMQNGGYNGMIAVSLAGIVYNIFIAFIAYLTLKVLPLDASMGMQFTIISLVLYYLVIYNIVLAVFNLLPIPPLDGSNALAYICLKFGITLPAKIFNKLERFGMALIILIIATPASIIIKYPIDMALRILQ